MRAFYCQQVFASLFLVAAWFGSALLLSGSLNEERKSSRELLSQNAPDKSAAGQVRHVPRHESSGEASRRYHIDSYGRKNKIEVDFADGGKGLIEYGLFGNVLKVIETKKDGSCLVFHFEPLGRSILKMESKNPDGSLKSISRPGKNTLERVLYQKDGFTPACRQTIRKDGSMDCEIYTENGKTIRARYSLKAQAENTSSAPYDGAPVQIHATLKVFEGNELVSEEEIRREGCHECGDDSCGNYQEFIHVRRFQKGRLHIEQEWQSYAGDSSFSLQSATEYGNEAKCKLRTLTPCYEAVGKSHAYQRIDHFDSNGKRLASQYLSSNGILLMETNEKGEKTVLKTGCLLQSPLLAAPAFKTFSPDYFNNKTEENRLEQMLSD